MGEGVEVKDLVKDVRYLARLAATIAAGILSNPHQDILMTYNLTTEESIADAAIEIAKLIDHKALQFIADRALGEGE